MRNRMGEAMRAATAMVIAVAVFLGAAAPAHAAPW
jgi:hypothetical protein